MFAEIRRTCLCASAAPRPARTARRSSGSHLPGQAASADPRRSPPRLPVASPGLEHDDGPRLELEHHHGRQDHGPAPQRRPSHREMTSPNPPPARPALGGFGGLQVSLAIKWALTVGTTLAITGGPGPGSPAVALVFRAAVFELGPGRVHLRGVETRLVRVSVG
jgi:hypothetical protein